MMQENATTLNVCGIDEAGRGPMAGPVCAASVILPPEFDVSILNDSKKMSEKNRDLAMSAIYTHSLAWGIGWASIEEIDTLNILKASLLAMKRSYLDMKTRFQDQMGDSTSNSNTLEVIVDGLFCPDLTIDRMRALPRADSLFPAVMAASILAKTARDRMMIRYSWLYPEYGYEKHKGYATKSHIKAMHEHGPSPIQRKSFRLKGEDQLCLF